MSEETEFETVKRLESIFKRLDRSGNGRIDIQDLSVALKDFGVSLQYAEVKRRSLQIVKKGTNIHFIDFSSFTEILKRVRSQ